jgi:hypothetical protein
MSTLVAKVRSRLTDRTSQSVAAPFWIVANVTPDAGLPGSWQGLAEVRRNSAIWVVDNSPAFPDRAS